MYLAFLWHTKHTPCVEDTSPSCPAMFSMALGTTPLKGLLIMLSASPPYYCPFVSLTLAPLWLLKARWALVSGMSTVVAKSLCQAFFVCHTSLSVPG